MKANETGQPAPGQMCRCGRLRNTADDLKRWHEEIEAVTGDRRGFNPAWSRAICWSSRPIDQCNMKHVSTMETPK